MSHLTEGQFEDVLQGRAEVPAHVAQCPQCRAYLAEQRVLARRVETAFASVRASPGLAGRMQARLVAAGSATAVKAKSRVISLRAFRSLGPGLALAAAVVVIVILRGSSVDTVARARAAQTALVGIHRINLDSLSELRNDARLGGRCRCTEGELDGPAMPCCERELCLCGCQMRDFQGRLVRSCVIEEPNAVPVSVVIVPESPRDLGMTIGRTTTATGQPVWQASCGSCNMASVRLGEESCCVIGQAPQDDLVAVLNAMGE
jgi:hypothetical protein